MHSVGEQEAVAPRRLPVRKSKRLKRLEAEAIGIIRELAAELRNPLMHYSIGKDSTVMVHLARLWEYIAAEDIAVGPLDFAALRPLVSSSGVWIMVEDERLPLESGERPEMHRARFRTLGVIR